MQHSPQIQDSLNELLEAVEAINKMVGVVRDISTKTDLLALNASIEAARAGQAGKGFAIVANEVARLSEKSQESISAVETACGNLRKNIDQLTRELTVTTLKAA